jgi:hypothetical protein
MTECPICGTSPASICTGGFDCPRCGSVDVGNVGPSDIQRRLSNLLGEWGSARSVHRRSRLSHLLRHGQRGAVPAKLSLEHTDRIDEPLPSPAEQLDYLIQWFGDHQHGVEPIEVPDLEVDAWIGSRINRQYQASGLAWLLNQSETERLLELCGRIPTTAMLRMSGWERYQALKQGRVESRKVFMAMKFGAEDVEHAYKNCFKPAVARTDFQLLDMREQQQAGMIDDHMRVAIRNSRFLIADLSHECRGSYWEGGFAEGLGRPVIYTCNAERWEKEKTHFDTNHLATVVWDVNNLDKAARELTNIIRNTLPNEAKMED